VIDLFSIIHGLIARMPFGKRAPEGVHDGEVGYSRASQNYPSRTLLK